MDIEGLGKLIEEKHAQTQLMFETVTKALDGQQVFCARSMECMASKIREHETTLTKIKTIGSLLQVVWGAIIVLISTWLGRK